MDFLLKLAALIFTACVVHSTEAVKGLKSFKLNENIIYDCVDIYEQPSLRHPLLKNHKIQMEPSFSISKSKNQVNHESERKKDIECPDGTVPIMRNTKSYVANAQYLEEKLFNPLMEENHGSRFAGVGSKAQGPYHGVAASMSVHDLNISDDQASFARIQLSSLVNNKLNYVEVGWMVCQYLFGDGRTWSYGFWKGANGTGCYNTLCPGFIQVSKNFPLSLPLAYAPDGQRDIYASIQQDKESGNWWVTDVKDNAPDIKVGYWPKELFDLIGNSAQIVAVSGGVHSSSSGKSPPMGNGHLPTEDDMASARVRDFYIMDENFTFKGSDKYRLFKILDNDKCYGLKNAKKPFLFTYGGPGGDSCPI